MLTFIKPNDSQILCTNTTAALRCAFLMNAMKLWNYEIKLTFISLLWLCTWLRRVPGVACCCCCLVSGSWRRCCRDSLIGSWSDTWHVTRDDPVARLVTMWQWLGSWHKCHTDTGSITELDWNSLERWSIEQLLHLMSCCLDDGRAANVWNCRYRDINTMQWEKYCKLQEIMIEDLAIEVNTRVGWAQACT